MYLNVERVGVSSQHVIVYYGATLVLICVVLSLLTKKNHQFGFKQLYIHGAGIFSGGKKLPKRVVTIRLDRLGVIIHLDTGVTRVSYY